MATSVQSPTAPLSFKDRFLEDVELDKLTKEDSELKACQSTGVQVRFVTFLQKIFTVFLGAEMVKASLIQQNFNAQNIDRKLQALQSSLKKNSRCVIKLGNHSGDQRLSRLINAKHNDFLRKLPEKHVKQDYSFLLWCLDTLEKHFNALKNTTSLESRQQCCKMIKDFLQVINELFGNAEREFENEIRTQITHYYFKHLSGLVMSDMLNFASSIQQSLVFRSVTNDFRESLGQLENFVIVDGFSQYSEEQLNLIERLIARLQITAVSEIIASFNMSFRDLLTALDNLPVSLKISDSHEHTVHAERARHKRNWASHQLPTGEGRIREFVDDGGSIIELFQPWILDTDSDEFKQKQTDEKKRHLSFVFPGLHDYFEKVSQRMLDCFFKLKNTLEQNEMLEGKVAELNRQLAEAKQQLDEEVKSKREWMAKYYADHPQQPPLNLGPHDACKSESSAIAQAGPPISPDEVLAQVTL